MDSESKSDGIQHFFLNLKSVGYLKSDCVGLENFVSVHLYNYFCTVNNKQQYID